MVKAAWGKKHTCPKCGTRFYDLGKKGPAVCIECEHKWVPEQILKAKQVHAPPPKPVAVEPAKPVAVEPAKPVAVEPDKPVAEDGASGTPAKDGASGTAAEDGTVAGDATDSDAAAIKELEVEVEDGGGDENEGVLGDVSLDDDKADLSEVVDTKLGQGGE